MTYVKGTRGLATAKSFSDMFPLVHGVDEKGNKKVQVISLDDFDAWAVMEGLMELHCERDTKNTRRNQLRLQINTTAASEAWRDLGEIPFHVRVLNHGVSYIVEPTAETYDVKANRLPTQIASLVNTKKVALETLLGSFDIGKLPLPLQVRVRGMQERIEGFLEQADFSANQLVRQFASLRKDVDNLVKEQLVIPQNHGIQALLDAVENGGDDTEE